MKFYVKQKVFSWGDKFNIYDESGNEVYFVQGKVFSMGKKLDLYDMEDNHLSHICQKLFTFLPRFFIERNNEAVAEVVKHFTLFKKRFSVTDFGWEVEGDFFDHEYEIHKDGYIIATVSKEWFTWGDAYLIDIADSIDPVDALSVVIIIDAMLAMSNNGGIKISFGT